MRIKLIIGFHLFFTLSYAQNIPSIEQVEAELEELKKKDDLRAYTVELARQRDSLIEVFNRQVFNLEQELTFTIDNAITSIDALYENKELLESKNTNLLADVESLNQSQAILENKNESLEEFADSLWNNNHPVFTWKDYEWIFEEAYSECLLKGREDFDLFFKQNQPWQHSDHEVTDEKIVWEGTDRINLDSSTLFITYYGSEVDLGNGFIGYGRQYVTFTELETNDLNSCKFRSSVNHIYRTGYGAGYMLINKSNPTLFGHYNYYGGHGIEEVGINLYEYKNLGFKGIPVDHIDNSQSMMGGLTLHRYEEALDTDTATYQWKEIHVLRSQHNAYPMLKIISNEEKRVGETWYDWGDTKEVITLPSISTIYIFDGSKYVPKTDE